MGKVSGHEFWVFQVLDLALLHLSKLIPEDVPTAMIWPLLLQLSAEPLLLLSAQLLWLLSPDHADGEESPLGPVHSLPHRLHGGLAQKTALSHAGSLLLQPRGSSVQKSLWGWMSVIRWWDSLTALSEYKSKHPLLMLQGHKPVLRDSVSLSFGKMCRERAWARSVLRQFKGLASLASLYKPGHKLCSCRAHQQMLQVWFFQPPSELFQSENYHTIC